MRLTLSGLVSDLPGNDRSADYSAAIAVPAGTGNTIVTIYTVPAAKIAVLRFANSQAAITTAAGQQYANVNIVRGGLTSYITTALSTTTSVVHESMSCAILLRPGDKVTTNYNNADGVARNIQIHAVIDEIDQ